MAKFKSALITQASGSIGGLTMSHNQSGMYIRARSTPVNPRTDLQQAVRVAQSTLSQRWVTVLTQEQRDMWTTYGANVARRNKLGDTIHLHGLPAYNRSNIPRIQVGLPIVDDAPTIYTVGDGLAGGNVIQDDVEPFSVRLVWTSGLAGTDFVLAYVSAPQNPTVRYFGGPYRYNGRIMGESLSLTLAPNPSWVKGQRLYVRVRVAYADGRLSDAQGYSIDLAETPVVPED